MHTSCTCTVVHTYYYNYFVDLTVIRFYNYRFYAPIFIYFLQYSVVKFWDRRPANETDKHLFFIFFEWKNNIIERSVLVYTTTPWSMGAGLCGVFLMLHRGYQLAQTTYKKAQKEKQRRSMRRQTIRELRRQRTLQEEQQPVDGSQSEGDYV